MPLTAAQNAAAMRALHLRLTPAAAQSIVGELPRGQYLRWDDREYQIGDILPPSRKWIDGDPTQRYLAGTCAIDPRQPLEYDSYQGGYSGYLYVISGKIIRRGQDTQEVILADPMIVRKIDAPRNSGI